MMYRYDCQAVDLGIHEDERFSVSSLVRQPWMNLEDNIGASLIEIFEADRSLLWCDIELCNAAACGRFFEMGEDRAVTFW
jgi:hypothetical protein